MDLDLTATVAALLPPAPAPAPGGPVGMCVTHSLALSAAISTPLSMRSSCEVMQEPTDSTSEESCSEREANAEAATWRGDMGRKADGVETAKELMQRSEGEGGQGPEWGVRVEERWVG